MIAKRELVERLWAEGKTGREIAVEVGWSVKDPSVAICILRKRGYDLPRRRSPEQVARMTIGADARMAKARAARTAA